MIEVNKLSWHARVYLWWYFTKWPHKREYGQRTISNLCPYVRTVLFWAPLRWLFYQGTVGSIRVAFVTVPTLLLSLPQPLGYLSYAVKRVLWSIDVVLGGLLVLGLFVFLLIQVFGWADQKWNLFVRLSDYADQRKGKRLSRKSMAKPKVSTGPSFWKLIGERISSAHDRVCPEIEFKAPSEMTGD